MILSTRDIQRLLQTYVRSPVTVAQAECVERYLAVFDLWSRRISLSTVQDPVHLVQRHFGEGLALAEALPPFQTLLDLGSGAGFPGLPIALYGEGLGIMLAESQKKKASFLKEAVWAMQLPVTVWPARAEDLPGETHFDVVTLRAVDHMPAALATAVTLLRPGGTLAFFVGERESIGLPAAEWSQVRTIPIAGSAGHAILATLHS